MDIIKSLLDCLYNNGKAIVCLYKEDSWGDINICFEMGKNYNLQLRETFFSSKENTNENILATDEIKTIINLIIKRALLNSSIRKYLEVIINTTVTCSTKDILEALIDEKLKVAKEKKDNDRLKRIASIKLIPMNNLYIPVNSGN